MIDAVALSKEVQVDIKRPPKGGGLYPKPLCIQEPGEKELLTLGLQVARDPREETQEANG